MRSDAYDRRQAPAMAVLRYLVQEEHCTVAEIAERLGVSCSNVYYRLRCCGLRHTPRGFDGAFDARYGPGAAQRCLELHASGSSLATIGRIFGFSRQYAWTVVRQLQRQGVPSRVEAP